MPDDAYEDWIAESAAALLRSLHDDSDLATNDRPFDKVNVLRKVIAKEDYHTIAAATWEGDYPTPNDNEGRWLMRFLPYAVARLLDRMTPGKRYRVIVEELVEDE